jgi:hypothetical protein
VTLSLAVYTPLIDYDAELGTGTPGTWADQSGNGWDATQVTPSKRMTLISGASMINGKPAFYSKGGTGANTGTFWLLPDAAFSGMTAAEAILIFKRDADPPTSTSTDGGFWNFGNGNANWQPYTNGWTYENFFSSARKDTIFHVSWRQSTTGKPHSYNMWSATNDWGVNIDWSNRIYQYSTASNTFQGPPSGYATLGSGSTASDGGAPGASCFNGHIWRFLLFARKLSTSDRNAIMASITSYYGVGVSLDFGPTRDQWQPPGTILDQNGNPVTDTHQSRSEQSTTKLSRVPTNGTLTDARRDKFPRVTEDRSSFSGGASFTAPITTNVVQYYKMRGRDPDCGTLTYRTWVVTGGPDFAGALYTGARCGVSPLIDVVVESTWDYAQ